MKERITRTRWIVLEDGQPTHFERTAETFGSGILGRKRRILVKVKSGEPHKFLSYSKANDEATRARLLGQFLRQSMVLDLPSIQHFVHRGVFTLKPVDRKERKNPMPKSLNFSKPCH